MRTSRNGRRIAGAFAAIALGCAATATPATAQPEGGKANGDGAPKAESRAQSEEEARRESERRRAMLRPSARLELAGKKLSIAYGPEPSDSDDFRRLETLADGETAFFTRQQAIKLSTEAHLAFGDAVVRAHNVAPNYPGVYSLWLARAGDGWKLVFNSKADVFGTQRRTEADVVSIPLVESKAEPVENLKIELAKGADDASATLKIAWGDRAWSAAFRVATEAEAEVGAGSAAAPPEEAAASPTAALEGDPKTWKNPFPADAAALAYGKSLYLRNCQQCHGADGRALENIDFEATDLTNPARWYHGTTEGEVFRSIKLGAGDDMPPYVDKLSDEEIWKLTAFVQGWWPKE